MKKLFLLITRESTDAWAVGLAQILQPLGKLTIMALRDCVFQELPPCDLIIIDAAVVKDARRFIGELRKDGSAPRVVIMTASPKWEFARAAFDAGALDYLSKNLHSKEILSSFQAALEKSVRPLAGTRG